MPPGEAGGGYTPLDSPRRKKITINLRPKKKKLQPRDPGLAQIDTEITVPYKWAPRNYQLRAWQALEDGVARSILLWHRRAGKDNVCLAWTTRAAFQRVGLYWHVFPTYNQGRKAIWDGMTKEGRRYLDYWPKELIKRGPIEDEMKIELVNGSIWQIIGTDDIDRIVGTNPVGVVMSEYSLQNPKAWDLIRPILQENGGWAIFPYTPRGKNHGHDLYNFAKKLMAKDPSRWFCQKLTVDDTRIVPDELIEEERESGMAEELIQQEYWCSFDAGLVGSYFGEQMALAEKQERVTRVPWIPHMRVDTWWDLGVRDATAIWFVQNLGTRINVIDYYQKSGKGLEHFAKVLQEKPYAYGRHIAPHDIRNTEWGSGKTRLDMARELGIRFDVAAKLKLQDGIMAARSLIARCWFDEVTCADGIRGLKEYHKEWDDERKCFADKPFHDWTSHPADAFRTGAVALRENRGAPTQVIAQDGWTPFGNPQEDAMQDYDMFNSNW